MMFTFPRLSERQPEAVSLAGSLAGLAIATWSVLAPVTASHVFAEPPAAVANPASASTGNAAQGNRQTGSTTTKKVAAARTDPAKANPANLRELIDQSLTWYEVYPDSQATEPATVIPALRWANNARGSEDGVTLLFVQNGLPVASACVYPWERRLEYCFESLSRTKLVAKQNGTVIWHPKETSVKFADIPNAPAPEASRAARLRQLKSLSQRFSATMLGWRADSTDREELRLLTRPLYRYDPRQGDVMDGAVLAFVMGTDPEVLLQIEAVQKGDQRVWQYAFSRRTSGELEGRLDGTAVWHAERFPIQNDPQRSHFTRGISIPAQIVRQLEEAEQAAKK